MSEKVLSSEQEQSIRRKMQEVASSAVKQKENEILNGLIDRIVLLEFRNSQLTQLNQQLQEKITSQNKEKSAKGN